MAFSFIGIIESVQAAVLGMSLAQKIDIFGAVLFIMALTFFIIKKRDKIAVQKILFPLLYIILYRTNFGIKLMEKISTKYKEHVKLFGYCAIGLGFFGMIFMCINILIMFFRMVFMPKVAEPGISLVLPFTNIPGIGYLSFWHFIISILVLAVIHEFAHGVVSKSHGIPVKSSGFAILGLFLPIIPAAFVEPDEKKMEKKNDVVQYSVFAAGPSINIIFALVILMIFPFTADFSGGRLAPYEEKITEPIGISFDVLKNESLPAAKAGLKDGMIISAINNEDVNDYSDFSLKLMKLRPNEEIVLTADGEDYTLITEKHPNFDDLAYIGIRPLNNERAVVLGYENIAPFYYWVKGLLRWLFLLNLFIGLANLLPLGIVDGGRMLKIALERTVKNKQRSKKIWAFIGFAFLLMLVLGLLQTYIGNPFALLP